MATSWNDRINIRRQIGLLKTRQHEELAAMLEVGSAGILVQLSNLGELFEHRGLLTSMPF